MVRQLVLVAFCLFAASCSWPTAGVPSTPTPDASGAYECVLRYQLGKQPADVKAFISVDGKDPSAELLTRLRKEWPNLRPMSEDPRQEGLRVYVEVPRWNEGKAVLKAGYWFPTGFGTEAYFADHHVIQENGQWVVKEVTNETMT